MGDNAGVDATAEPTVLKLVTIEFNPLNPNTLAALPIDAIAEPLAVRALDANVQRIVVLHFQKDDLDEHLRFRAVQAGDDVADLFAGRLVGNDDDVLVSGST